MVLTPPPRNPCFKSCCIFMFAKSDRRSGWPDDALPTGRLLPLAFLCALALAGCTAATESGQGTPPPAAPEAPAAVCAVPGECAPQAASSAFGRMIAAAVYASPEVTQSKADLSAARAGFGTAQGSTRPQLGAQAETDTITLSLRQPIWSGGKLRANIADAAAATRQAEANLATVQLDMANRIIDAAGRWAEADAAMRALATTVADYSQTADILDARIMAGVSGASDAELMGARRALIEADLMSAQANRDLALAQLGALIGQNVDESVLRQAVAAAAKGPTGGYAIDEVIAAHPGILAADAAIARATARLASVRADRFPTVAVVAESRMSDIGSSDAQETSRVFLGMTTSLGPGTSQATRRAEAESQIAAQEAARAVKMRGLSDEVTALELRHKAAKARLVSNSRAIDANAAVVESYKSQLTTTGARSWQDLLGAVRDLGDARRSKAASEAELMVSYWRLRVMTGGVDGL